MDRRERSGKALPGFLAMMAGLQSGIYTALPGIVQSFDPTKRTVVVQPAIQARVQKPDGSFQWVDLPLLLDCPVMFPSGGGVTLTFPIAAGNETLVIFASRCIDAWWQSGGYHNQQMELRMHDLSDGFAFVGISSLPQVIANISTTKAQLRTDNGLTYIDVDPAGNVDVVAAANINAQAGGNLTANITGTASITAPTINLAGNVNITGNLAVTGNAGVSGAMTNAGVNIGKTHVHSGVTTGSSNTGGPQ